jgi:hypothetical protein
MLESEAMATGLALAGFTFRYQQVNGTDLNGQRFSSHYGANPVVVCAIWRDLTTTNIVEGRINSDEADIKRLFLALHFLKCYPTASGR